MYVFTEWNVKKDGVGLCNASWILTNNLTNRQKYKMSRDEQKSGVRWGLECLLKNKNKSI